VAGAGARVIDDALRVVRRLEVGYLSWGRYAECCCLRLDRIIDGAAESPRIRAGAQIYGAIAAARAGHHDLAVAYGAAARTTHPTPAVALAGLAAEVRGWLAQGERARALALAPPLAAHAAGPHRPEFDELVRLAWCEAAGVTAAAIAQAADAVLDRAATLADPLRRNEYLARPHLVAQLLALATGAGRGGP
jgi:hypothetical protein